MLNLFQCYDLKGVNQLVKTNEECGRGVLEETIRNQHGGNKVTSTTT